MCIRDRTNIDILDYNVKFLKKQSAIKDVICIPQVNNLEDELVGACNVKNVIEITKSNSLKEYKRELISCTNLGKRLQVCGFNILKFWNKLPKNSYEKYGNDSSKIKKVKK